MVIVRKFKGENMKLLSSKSVVVVIMLALITGLFFLLSPVESVLGQIWLVGLPM